MRDFSFPHLFLFTFEPRLSGPSLIYRTSPLTPSSSSYRPQRWMTISVPVLQNSSISCPGRRISEVDQSSEEQLGALMPQNKTPASRRHPEDPSTLVWIILETLVLCMSTKQPLLLLPWLRDTRSAGRTWTPSILPECNISKNFKGGFWLEISFSHKTPLFRFAIASVP